MKCPKNIIDIFLSNEDIACVFVYPGWIAKPVKYPILNTAKKWIRWSDGIVSCLDVKYNSNNAVMKALGTTVVAYSDTGMRLYAY